MRSIGAHLTATTPGSVGKVRWNATCYRLTKVVRSSLFNRNKSPLAVVALACVLSVAATARGQVVQTGDNTPLPQAVGQPEIQLSMDLGWRENTPAHQDIMGANLNPPGVYTDFFPTFRNGDAVKLSGLFKWRKEQIDERANARTAPGYFSPTCGFTAELVLRGGDCNVQFGWYNVADPNNPTPPAPNEIYPLVPESTEADSKCVGQNSEPKPAGSGFCPLGWDNHHPYKLPQLAWTPKPHDSGRDQEQARVQGRLRRVRADRQPFDPLQADQALGRPAQRQELAAVTSPGSPTLIYQSTIDPEGFYIAFEDLPMAPESWKNPVNGAANDGDFNDFVYYISGINCAGGGQPCTTPLKGACSLGRTDCAATGETPTCRPIIQPGAELCDNVDNDCNGVVDDGEGLCPAGYACDQGTCVRSCTGGEFACRGTLVCENERVRRAGLSGSAVRSGSGLSRRQLRRSVRQRQLSGGPGVPARPLHRPVRRRQMPGRPGVRARAVRFRLRLPRLQRRLEVRKRWSLQRSAVRRNHLPRGPAMSSRHVRRSVRRGDVSRWRPVRERHLQ